jgi:hypothetical protein
MASDARIPGRRLILLSGLGIATLRSSAASRDQDVYRFATDGCDIRVRVEFHDRYSSRGFWFNDPFNRPFCLSPEGEKARNCAAKFVGSLAIARYEIRCRSKDRRISMLREHVRNIDCDDRVEPRPPYDRKIELHRGTASDIQAFGYTDTEKTATAYDSVSPWYYFRQDLFLEAETAPFLILHWKHALNAIRMLDIMPAGGTSVVSR